MARKTAIEKQVHVNKAGQALPRTIWVLGFVSLFMDLSSELVHSLMPIFLVGTLGASVLTVGIIEGIAEATALIIKVFSGAISDFVGRAKGCSWDQLIVEALM